MTFRRYIVASFVMAAVAAAPPVASASSLCDPSLFSSISSPLSFASSIESAYTQSQQELRNGTGTHNSSGTQVCIAYIVNAQGPAGCQEYETTSSGTSTENSTGTSSTIAYGERAMADAQRLVMDFQRTQQNLCSLEGLRGLSFSQWASSAPGLVQTGLNIENGFDQSQTDMAQMQSDLDNQQQNNAQQAQYIANTLVPNVTGEASATQVNTAYLELLAAQQQQMMERDMVGGVQFGNAMLPMAPAMMGNMFDANEPADAGWYF